MNGNTHSTVGFTVGAVACTQILTDGFSSWKAIGLGSVLLGCSVLGSLLPDADHPYSTISKKHRIILFPYRVINKICSAFRIKGFEHRGILHSFLIPTVLGVVAGLTDSLVLKYILFGIFIGYISHIFCDALNPTGVPIFWPIYREKVKLLPKRICIPTNSVYEIIFRWIIRVVTIPVIFPLIVSAVRFGK